MSRAASLRSLALLISLCAGAPLLHAEPSPDDSAEMREGEEAGLELRLADGSLLRVPFNAAAKRMNGRVEQTAGEIPSTGIRRASTRQRAKVFDPETPGVIASVRG